MVYDSYKHHSKYPFDNYQNMFYSGASYFYGIVYWPGAHNSKCNIKKANLYGYVHDSYKHHSKYPFDNYWINVLQWGGHISMA